MSSAAKRFAVGQLVPFHAPPSYAPRTPSGWRLFSRLLAGLVLLIGCGLAVALVGVLTLGLACGGAFLSMGPDAAYLGHDPGLPGVVPFASLPAATRAAYAATLLLDTAPVLYVLAQLRALLQLYASGRAFGSGHGRSVRRMAVGLVASALTPALGRVLVLLAGHGVDSAWFHASAVEALVLAAVLPLVATAMDAGDAAERDSASFI